MSVVKAAVLPGLLLLVGGCGGEQREQTKKLDDILARLERIEKKVDQGGRVIRPPVPTPAQPDPKTVYSVPVEGDPVKGPKVAKVTIVEATDFA